jgi:hypothetical protein
VAGWLSLGLAWMHARAGRVRPSPARIIGPWGEPMPCGSLSKADSTLSYIKEVGHKGRHKYRPLVESSGMN